MALAKEQPLAEIVHTLGELRDYLFREGRFTAATHIGQAVHCLSISALSPLQFLDD